MMSLCSRVDLPFLRIAVLTETPRALDVAAGAANDGLSAIEENADGSSLWGGTILRKYLPSMQRYCYAQRLIPTSFVTSFQFQRAASARDDDADGINAAKIMGF